MAWRMSLRGVVYTPFLYPFLFIVVFVFFVIPRQERDFLPWVALIFFVWRKIMIDFLVKFLGVHYKILICNLLIIYSVII